MAKEVIEQSETIKPKAEQQKGVTFIKNQVNETVILPSGETMVFEKSRQTFIDEKLIEGLRRVAKNHNIIEVEE